MPRKYTSKSKRTRSSRRRSRSKVRIPVTKGKMHGYSLSDSLDHRRKILHKIAKKDTWEEVVKRLNVLYIYNKNKHPEIAQKFKRDMIYIQRLYEKERTTPLRKVSYKSKSIKKRSRRSKRRSGTYGKRRSSIRTSRKSIR
jgi:hypothetical protein